MTHFNRNTHSQAITVKCTCWHWWIGVHEQKYQYQETKHLLYKHATVTLTEAYNFSSKAVTAHLRSKTLNIINHKTVILPVLLFCYETWSLLLMQKHKLKVNENKILRENICTINKQCGVYRKLHKKEHSNWYCNGQKTTFSRWSPLAMTRTFQHNYLHL
jgi:hypothetical protein